MKIRWHLLLNLSVLCACAPLAGAQSFSGQITVTPSQAVGPISPLIFGLGIEWINNGDGVLDPATGAIRADIVKELKPLRIPVWRFPGGILADYYNWQDGMGLNRPARQNPMDGQMYSNAFGTDEFIAFCNAQGSAGLITANYGTGSLAQALAWQSYFKSRNFPATFWEVGNEIYMAPSTAPVSIPGDDARIFKTNSAYAADFHTWAQALHANDPNALVGAIGGLYNVSSEHVGWLNTLLTTSSRDLDFLALHDSFAPIINSSYDMGNARVRNSTYNAMFAQALYTEDDIKQVKQILSSAGARPRIAVTEHFPLFGGSANMSTMLALIDQTRTTGSALFTASLMHTYIRENAFMANYNLAFSQWFGGLLTDAPGGLIETPTYHVYDLFRNHFGTTAVNVQTTGPVFNTQQIGVVPARVGVPSLDAVASTDAGGVVYLSVINRGNAFLDVKLNVQGILPGRIAQVWSVSASADNVSTGATLSPTTVAGNVALVHTTWSTAATGVYRFPGNSITVLSW